MNLPTFSGKHTHRKVEREFLRLLLQFSMGPSSKCLSRNAFSCWLAPLFVDFYWVLEMTLSTFLVEEELSPSLPDVKEDSGNVRGRQNKYFWVMC